MRTLGLCLLLACFMSVWAMADDNDKLYKAEYHGSGTFTISKPKRKARKLRQSKLKNPQRGARK